MTHRDTGVAIKISLLIQCSSRIESQALNARQGTSVAIKQAIYISIPYDRAIQPGYISTQGFSASMPLNDTSLAIKEAICRGVQGVQSTALNASQGHKPGYPYKSYQTKPNLKAQSLLVYFNKNQITSNAIIKAELSLNQLAIQKLMSQS